LLILSLCLVPHDFGKNKPVIIDSFEIMKLKQQQLEALMDISIASQLLASADEELTRTHPLDRNYNKLGLDLKPVRCPGLPGFDSSETYLTAIIFPDEQIFSRVEDRTKVYCQRIQPTNTTQ
jgi:hypothetical protein